MSRPIPLITTLILLNPLICSAATEVPTARIETPPVIDGRLDDPQWQTVSACSNFLTFRPSIGERTSEETVAYCLYDADNLYVAFCCRDQNPAQIKATLGRRDNVWTEDYVGVAIDPSNDGQFAPLFCSNPLGVQNDALVRPDAEGIDSHDWVYESAGALTDFGYTVEMRIPVKNLRKQEGEEVEMGLGFCRSIVRNSEYSIYPGFFPDRGAYASQLGRARFVGLRSRRTFEILPSITHSYHRTLIGEQYETTLNTTEFGVTAKVGLTSHLICDATFNPDFSQIESDAGRVDVNLRYPNFFEEKRPFFMEGLEQFNLAGQTQFTAIGAAVSTRNIAAPRFGVKVTGKASPKSNLAVLMAGDKSPRSYNPGVNKDAYFGVVRYRLLQDADNFVGGIIGTREYDKGYNRTIGVDFAQKLSAHLTLVGDYLHFLTRLPTGGDPWGGRNVDLTAIYRDRSSEFQIGINDITKNTPLEIGFIPRDGITALGMSGNHRFQTGGKILQRMIPSFYTFYQRDKYYRKDEGLIQGTLALGLIRSSVVQLSAGYYRETYVGNVYDLDFIKIEMNSQPINSLFLRASGNVSGKIYYNPAAPFQGDQRNVEGSVIWQATDKLSAEAGGGWIWFWRRADGGLIYDYRLYRYRTTYQISRDLFLRGVVEYNAYRDEVLTDLLASFTYIPGTVVYLGYGALADERDNDLTLLKDREQGVFFKASYNWRM